MSAWDARLFAGRVELEEEIAWSGLGELFVYSRRSPVKTTDNEDAALVLRVGEEQGIVAIADGAGGYPAGEQASARALQCLLRALEESLPAGESMRGAVLSGLDGANRAVRELGTGSATTLAAVTIDGKRIRAYHVGDSGVLAFGSRGRVKLETIPHSPVGYGVEAGLIAADDALDHEERHLVSNLVGHPDMHIGVSSPLDLAPLDRVLLASDGLFDNAPLDEIVEAARKGGLADSVRSLASACHARMADGGHADDLTLIAYRPA